MKTTCIGTFSFLSLGILSLAFGLMSFNFGSKGSSRFETFRSKLDSARLTFTIPKGFKETVVCNSAGKDCAIAYRNKKTGMELRYYIYSFDPHSHSAKCGSGPVCLVPEPEKYFKERFHNTIRGLSAFPDYTVKPILEVRTHEYFNATEAGYSVVGFNRQTNDDYRNVIVLYLQKEKTGGAIVACLSRNGFTESDDVPVIETGLKFN